MSQITYPLYLDHHATTPVDPRVLEAMLPYFTEHFGNAESSQHSYGWKAKAAVDQAREKVAHLINADAQEILFTAGATESIHLAILGLLETQNTPSHVITSNAEHKCVLEVCARAEKLGHEITILPVDRFGRIQPEQVEAALKPNTALVTLIHGNNEIGSLNPIAAIGKMLQGQSQKLRREESIVFHVDAAQTIGKVAIDVRSMGIGLLSMSAHKFYGPKGVGALFVNRAEGRRVHLKPFLTGGGQERGLRGGTHNVPGIVGIGRAAELCGELMVEESARLTQLRDQLIHAVREGLGPERVDLNGHPTERLPNNVNLTLHGVDSSRLLMGLRAIAFSSSSACSSGTASHVLQAIGQKADDPLSATLRLGLGRSTTEADIDFTITRILETARQM